jgi:type 1 glutamine amidotransferase
VVRFLIAAACAAGLAAVQTPAADPPKKLLVIGSPPDGHPPATHEYVAGADVLAKCLKPVAGVEVTVVKAEGPWTEGPELIARVDGVVLFLTEGAKWVSADEARLAAFRKLAARGGGLACLHWGMGTREAGPIPAFVELFGGCHGGPDRKFQVVESAAVTVADPKHPAVAGIKDFTVKEEYYYRLKFPAGGVKPLLKVMIDGSPETVAWAWERPGGGRSFGFSGLHFHENWRRVEYRRLVAQGMLWTLGLPVPPGGLAVEVSDADLRLPGGK